MLTRSESKFPPKFGRVNVGKIAPALELSASDNRASIRLRDPEVGKSRSDFKSSISDKKLSVILRGAGIGEEMIDPGFPKSEIKPSAAFRGLEVGRVKLRPNSENRFSTMFGMEVIICKASEFKEPRPGVDGMLAKPDSIPGKFGREREGIELGSWIPVSTLPDIIPISSRAGRVAERCSRLESKLFAISPNMSGTDTVGTGT